jgi:hypothetical protein
MRCSRSEPYCRALVVRQADRGGVSRVTNGELGMLAAANLARVNDLGHHRGTSHLCGRGQRVGTRPPPGRPNRHPRRSRLVRTAVGVEPGRRPAAGAHRGACRTADVAASVRHARSHGLSVARRAPATAPSPADFVHGNRPRMLASFDRTWTPGPRSMFMRTDRVRHRGEGGRRPRGCGPVPRLNSASRPSGTGVRPAVDPEASVVVLEYEVHR